MCAKSLPPRTLLSSLPEGCCDDGGDDDSEAPGAVATVAASAVLVDEVTNEAADAD